ncbi:MAG: hypothetical protein M3M97_04355 [Actinomycetota bacterium]|nr:hypothetical protein [Actinomycetota bacterium]
MNITDFRTAVVEANYDWAFIRVYTDKGITGLGERFLTPGLTAITQDLKPLLVREDPRNVDKLWPKMRWATSDAGGGLPEDGLGVRGRDRGYPHLPRAKIADATYGQEELQR